MADEIKEIAKEVADDVKKVARRIDLKKWKNRKMKVVNDMQNHVKAEAAARRILRNN